jgi:hypothetical protein
VANVQLLSSLRTAVSAQNHEWLDANEAEIRQRHDAGQMDDEARDELIAIVELAREGKWEEAERRIVDLQRAQRAADSPSPTVRNRGG